MNWIFCVPEVLPEGLANARGVLLHVNRRKIVWPAVEFRNLIRRYLDGGKIDLLEPLSGMS